MKTTRSRLIALGAALAAALILAAIAFAAPSTVSAQLDRADIALGDSAQLTLTVPGGSPGGIALPVVPGLEFVAEGQSSQTQIINGVTTSTTSVTYEVIPQHTGTFTIPALSPGSKALALTVHPGNANHSNNSRAPILPPPATHGFAAGQTHLTQDTPAFVRLLLPKRELYVGETVPVDIQVGLRPGLVASLDGLPILNGDSFTLNKLSSKPEQTETTIAGKPYTLLTWHSILAAVKPGAFSLTVDTPLTVTMRTAPPRRLPSPQGFFDDPTFGNPFGNLFDDSFFQDFFGGTTEKQITVKSDPDTLKVLALPSAGRPAEFSGAVGQFEVRSELSAAKGAAGDPLTLRLKVNGKGDFDRVNSAMLGETDGWKTYTPAARFGAADSVGYSGEKDFEQAIIPMQPGQQTVPPLAFSYFNPETRKYESKLTAPLSVDVSAAPAGSLDTANAPAAGSTSGNEPPHDGLRPDHVETGGAVATLLPVYFQPWFLGTQIALILGFAGGFVFLRQRESRAADTEGARRREASSVIEHCLAEMDAASAAGDSVRFFQSARAALQEQLAMHWHVAPASITIAEIDTHRNDDSPDIRGIFALADQATYSGQHFNTADFRQWKENILTQLKQMEAV